MITDLPEFQNKNNIIGKITSYMRNNIMNNKDGYVLVSKYMSEKIKKEKSGSNS